MSFLIRTLSSRVNASLKNLHLAGGSIYARSNRTTAFDGRSNYSTDEKGEERVPSDNELKLIDLLRKRFPKAKTIDVIDISGGCGAMYTIFVETVEFKNLRTVKQHQLINDTLKHEIKNNMHGLRIQTAVPSE